MKNLMKFIDIRVIYRIIMIIMVQVKFPFRVYSLIHFRINDPSIILIKQYFALSNS